MLPVARERRDLRLRHEVRLVCVLAVVPVEVAAAGSVDSVEVEGRVARVICGEDDERVVELAVVARSLSRRWPDLLVRVLAMKRSCTWSNGGGYTPVSVIPPHMCPILSTPPRLTSMPLQGSLSIIAMRCVGNPGVTAAGGRGRARARSGSRPRGYMQEYDCRAASQRGSSQRIVSGSTPRCLGEGQR